LLFAPDTKKYKASSLAYLWHHLEGDLQGRLSDVKDRLERHTAMRFREDLAKLVGASQGTIALSTWENRHQVALSPQDHQHPQEPRRFQAQPARHWGITSYSSLVGHGETVETPDRDTPDPLPAPEIPADQLSGMDALPRGARIGNMLHALYENLSFQASAEAIHTEAKTQLEVHGLSVDDWLGVLTHHTLDFFHSDLGEFRLSDISGDKRLNELAFHFPIGNLTVTRLERFFEEHQLLSRQNAFDFFPIEGFLKGFVDLVVQHDGRFFIADYKSNFLGGHADDYHHERLPGIMADSNYVIQYHLYTVALHRYLQYRLGDAYDYDTHFGGVRYLFVRGIRQETSPDYGVFADRPSAALVDALSQFLANPQEAEHG
jgi:exodeoxyribonuclease V beta subunit